MSALLKPGGYFFGITPDSSTIWYEICLLKTRPLTSFIALSWFDIEKLAELLSFLWRLLLLGY